jgi:hypothetical protein
VPFVIVLLLGFAAMPLVPLRQATTKAHADRAIFGMVRRIGRIDRLSESVATIAQRRERVAGGWAGVLLLVVLADGRDECS